MQRMQETLPPPEGLAERLPELRGRDPVHHQRLRWAVAPVMTRPVTEILEQARREGWPTSFIDAMANHHLCGNLARDYVNACFEPSEPAAGSEPGVLAAPQPDAAPPGPAGAAPTYLTTEGEPVGKLTPEQLAQVRDASKWLAERGEDGITIAHLHDIGVAQAAAENDPPATTT